jgi:hypothetical protein
VVGHHRKTLLLRGTIPLFRREQGARQITDHVFPTADVLREHRPDSDVACIALWSKGMVKIRERQNRRVDQGVFDVCSLVHTSESMSPEKFGTNRQYQLIIPIRRRTSRTLFGCGMSTTALTLAGAVEGLHSPPEITPRQELCRNREWTPRPELPVVPPGLRSVVANFMGKSGGSEGGLSVPLIG